jgi:hypothetical protein
MPFSAFLAQFQLAPHGYTMIMICLVVLGLSAIYAVARHSSRPQGPHPHLGEALYQCGYDYRYVAIGWGTLIMLLACGVLAGGSNKKDLIYGAILMGISSIGALALAHSHGFHTTLYEHGAVSKTSDGSVVLEYREVTKMLFQTFQEKYHPIEGVIGITVAVGYSFILGTTDRRVIELKGKLDRQRSVFQYRDHVARVLVPTMAHQLLADGVLFVVPGLILHTDGLMVFQPIVKEAFVAPYDAVQVSLDQDTPKLHAGSVALRIDPALTNVYPKLMLMSLLAEQPLAAIADDTL